MPVTVGTEVPPFTMSDIDLPRIREFMELMGDTNPVHDDQALTERLGLRGPVNQGPANLGYVLNMLLAWGGGPTTVERLEFRFMEIVTVGDEVTARGVVTGVEDADDGQRVECDVRLELADGTPALVGTARVRLRAGEEEGA